RSELLPCRHQFAIRAEVTQGDDMAVLVDDGAQPTVVQSVGRAFREHERRWGRRGARAPCTNGGLRDGSVLPGAVSTRRQAGSGRGLLIVGKELDGSIGETPQ